MEYALYFIGFGFGGALLLYAMLLRLTLNVRLLPRYDAGKVKNPKGYVRSVSHILAFLALALLTGGWVGSYAGPLMGFLTMAVALVLAIWLSVRLWKSSHNKNR